ncbi:MAG: response regulator [Patescibacteria group bacterium]|nr:response regulator [Patescibacteria group bacterium]
MEATQKKQEITVCIVEDEEMIAEMYRIKLEEKNFQVFVASDGEKGFEIIKRVKPDIALIDIMMPNKDGISLIKNIRKDPSISRIPVIILTNLDNSEIVKKTYDLDVDFYLIKSQYRPSDVVKIVKEVLSSKHIMT